MADKAHLSNGNPSAADKYRTQLTIISKQEHERVEHTVDADVYRKGVNIYVRYEEPVLDPEGVKRRSSSTRTVASGEKEAKLSTNVMLKLGPTEWKLTRRGAVESEMSFAPDMRLNGYYRSEVLRFPLVTHTKQWTRHDLTVEQNGVSIELPEYVAWTYDLYIEDRMAGQFALEWKWDWSQIQEKE